MKAEVAAEAAYDASLSNPWATPAKGTLSGEMGVSLALGVLVGGSAGDWTIGVGTYVEGSSKIALSGSVAGVGNAIVASGAVDVDALRIKVVGRLEAGPFEVRPVLYDEEFFSGSSRPIGSITLVTF